jgi:hypothetical protein
MTNTNESHNYRIIYELEIRWGGMILEEIDSLFDGAIGFFVEDDISSFFRSEKQYRIRKANLSMAEGTPI